MTTVRLVMLLLGGLSASTYAAPQKLLLAIGANVGDADDVPLQYATADAERVAQLFIDIGGVSADRAVVLLDPSATQVRERLAELAGRMAELRAAGHDVVFVLYVSAHAKAGALHLSGTHLPLSELREFSANVAARLRLLVIDACDSGVIARQKGGTPGQGYEVALERLPLAGHVVISSSGPTEASQEWESLGGSLFTHHWLTGLRGDADVEGDGHVTLAEAYAYAYRRTVANSAVGGQHPAFDVDLTGTGELVLSEPSSGPSALTFAAALEGRYVVAKQPRADVVCEVEKHAGRALRLAVPPGRYLVRKRLGASWGLLSVELPYGGESAIDERSMVRRSATEVALKGAQVELRPSAISVWGALQTEPLLQAGGRGRFGAVYRRTWGAWWLAGGGLFGLATFRGNGVQVSETTAGAMASAGYRWLFTPLIPEVGLAVEVLGVWQHVQRDDEVQLARALGVAPLAPRSTVGVSMGPTLGVEVPLVASTFAAASVQGLARYLPVEGQSTWSFGVQGALALGVRF